MPVFEAVVNSIHSIEEKGNLGNGGAINLQLNRSAQNELDIGSKSIAPIVSFKIEDNGCGFDDTNFSSFETLDSDHKIDKGCRGVGRLLWLKAFEQVEITSTFTTKIDKYQQRQFYFDDKLGVHHNALSETKTQSTGTVIKLKGFDEAYCKAVPTKAEAIANQLLEHCLWYFVRPEGAPDIYVHDGTEHLSLYKLYDDHMHASAHNEAIEIMGQSFELTHIKFRASVNKKHQLALCAANRLVKEENIQGKIPGLYGKIADQSGEFTYTCYVSSPYLDEHVRSERTSFDIADNFDGIFSETEITLKAIREAVIDRTKDYLQDVLAGNIAAGKKRVDDFISINAPRYRPIINYIDEMELIVDPEKSDKELELHLHSQWYEVERQLLNDGHDIMKPANEEHAEEYQERLKDYLQKAQDLKKSDLANYVSHRKVIIDLLQKSIERLDDGKYAREDIIHELIMPMRKDSTDVFLDSCNLWLIDERLAFHNYLGSDKTLNAMPITDSVSTKEPDLLSLRVFDNPLLVNERSSFPLASITVIEIKRPMRNDMKDGEDKNPIDQSLGYLNRVREGKAKTNSGLLIPGSQTIPGYCYVLCDLTEKMVERCKLAGLNVTADGMGYFGYNKPYEAYIEVISFNQLVRAAKERNRAFFDKLGLASL
tara:strand:- start:14899 stop:16860 length:1962 start_codon:yes stop_codon:yes gene_type:complete